MALIVSDEEGNEIVEQKGYEDEAEMQEYIEENPEAIPLYQIDDKLEISIAAREFTVDGEYIDAVAFDQNGGVYILETKLSTNADKRKVIAQAFDYGAALWDNQHPNQFANNLDSSVEGYDSFRSWAEEEFELSEEEFEQFKANVFDNLEDGNFSYVIVMDEISDRLKTIIKYLTANSMFDLYGVELEYYKNDGNTIVVPNLYGTEVKKNTNSTTRSSRDSYKGRKELWRKIEDKFESLIDDEPDLTNGSRYRQARFPRVPSHHHIEWIFGKEDGERVLKVRLDFEKSKAPEHNQEMLDYFRKEKMEELKNALDTDEVKTVENRVHRKIYIQRKVTVEEAKENEEIQDWAAEKGAKLYNVAKEPLQSKIDGLE